MNKLRPLLLNMENNMRVKRPTTGQETDNESRLLVVVCLWKTVSTATREVIIVYAAYANPDSFDHISLTSVDMEPIL